MWGWFGGQSAQSRKDTPKNAILGLRSQLEMLQKRERHLQTQMDEQDGIARKSIATNKNGEFAYLARLYVFWTGSTVVMDGRMGGIL
jgi:charged multivesicular body protein 4